VAVPQGLAERKIESDTMGELELETEAELHCDGLVDALRLWSEKMLVLLAETQEVTLVVKELVGVEECELHGVLLPLTEGEALTVRLGEREREVHVLAESEGVSDELAETVAQVVELREGLSVPEGVKLPEEVIHPEGVTL
jgi:hypothetical protein